MNPTLSKIVSDMDAKMKPTKYYQTFRNFVLAGQKILYDPKQHAQMELVKNPESRKHPVDTIANGIVGLLWLMFAHTDKSEDSIIALVSAGSVLMADVMDMAQQSYGIQFNDQMIAACTKEFLAKIFAKMGVPPEQLQQMINDGAAKQAQGTANAA